MCEQQKRVHLFEIKEKKWLYVSSLRSPCYIIHLIKLIVVVFSYRTYKHCLFFILQIWQRVMVKEKIAIPAINFFCRCPSSSSVFPIYVWKKNADVSKKLYHKFKSGISRRKWHHPPNWTKVCETICCGWWGVVAWNIWTVTKHKWPYTVERTWLFTKYHQSIFS